MKQEQTLDILDVMKLGGLVSSERGRSDDVNATKCNPCRELTPIRQERSGEPDLLYVAPIAWEGQYIHPCIYRIGITPRTAVDGPAWKISYVDTRIYEEHGRGSVATNGPCR